RRERPSMSLFDGEAGPLTLGQAFCELAKLAPFGHDDLREEMLATFHTAFPDDVTKYVNAGPSTGVTDPQVQALNAQAITLAKQAQELAELRAQLAEAQLAEARAKLAAIDAGVKPSDVDPVAAAAAEEAETAKSDPTAPKTVLAAASARTPTGGGAAG